MGKSKKTASKSKSQERREAAQTKSKVEARPIGEGKDPLAEGERLVNPTNTTGETHYEADSSELNAENEAAKNRIGGQDADTRAEQHNAESPTAPDNVPETATSQQDEVAEGRVEPDSSDPAEEPETPESDDAEEEEPTPPADGTDTEEDPLAAEANDKAV